MKNKYNLIKLFFAFFFFIAILLLMKEVFSSSGIYTPNGSNVGHHVINDELSDYQIQTRRQEIIDDGWEVMEIAAPSKRYNCHSYAWYSQDYENNNYWIDNPYIYISDGSYVTGVGEVGEIVVYLTNGYGNLDNNILHSAIIVSNPDEKPAHLGRNSITVISKWGDKGLYQHKLGVYEENYYDIISYRPAINDTLLFSESNDFLSKDETIMEGAYRKYKLIITDASYYTINLTGTNINSIKLFNSNNIETLNIDDCFTIESNKILNTFLNSGTYYVEFSAIGDVTFAIRKNNNIYDSTLIDPGENWVCGSEINILNNGTYNSTTINEGFTRIIYFDSSRVSNLSRLDYYWWSSDSNAAVTDYGTVLALPTNTEQSVTIYAAYKNDPTIVYCTNFLIKPYYGSIITIDINLNINVADSQYLSIGEYLPYNWLQYYEWTSSDSNILTINSLGKYQALCNGNVTITGIYSLNKRIRINISINIL